MFMSISRLLSHLVMRVCQHQASHLLGQVSFSEVRGPPESQQKHEIPAINFLIRGTPAWSPSWHSRDYRLTAQHTI